MDEPECTCYVPSFDPCPVDHAAAYKAAMARQDGTSITPERYRDDQPRDERDGYYAGPLSSYEDYPPSHDEL